MNLNKSLLSVLALGLALCWLPPQVRSQETDPPAPAAPAAPTAETNAVEKATAEAVSVDEARTHVRSHDAMVVVGNSAELKKGEQAEAVVVIGGTATVRGKVNAAAVVIAGDLFLEEGAEVGDAAVSVLGTVHVKPGAVVKGDVVAVGGKVDAAEGAVIKGHQQSVGFGLPEMKWLQDWFVQCVLKMRPLAPQVGWVWAVAGVFLLLYLFIALVFQKPVRACVDELERRPATTFLLGLLTKLVLPVLLVLLIATGLGLFVIPFILAALLLGVIVGKVAILEWFGYRFSKTLPPVVAFLIGALILTIFYIIPIFGLIMFAVTGLWGLGATVSAVFGSLRREMPEKPAATPLSPVPPAPGATPGPISTPGTIAPLACNVGAEAAAPTGESVPPSLAVPGAVPPAVPEALSYPRATFWERLGAGLIDLILISILSAFVGGPPLGFLVAAAYFIGLWMWKGTTVGGVVVQLRVVRQDGQKITFPVALVRLLIGVFSMMVLFLGFLWIAWDAEKQSWHDKVAGTVVVRMPKGTPLLVL